MNASMRRNRCEMENSMSRGRAPHEPAPGKQYPNLPPANDPHFAATPKPEDVRSGGNVRWRGPPACSELGDLNQAKVWEEYFAGNEGRFSCYAHVKNPAQVNALWLKEAIISQRVETEWGKISLVQATLALLRVALLDGQNQWFVLADSCAPIKPFQQLLWELSFDGRSRFYWESHAEMERTNRDKANRIQGLKWVTPMYVRFHPQWWLLNREAAEAAAEDDFTEYFANLFAADEMYFGTVLRMKGYPLDGRVLKRDITKVSWPGGHSPHPATFDKLGPDQVADFASSECYFARKFSQKCALAKFGLHVLRTRVVTWRDKAFGG
jgi:hypothetical protein